MSPMPMNIMSCTMDLFSFIDLFSKFLKLALLVHYLQTILRDKADFKYQLFVDRKQLKAVNYLCSYKHTSLKYQHNLQVLCKKCTNLYPCNQDKGAYYRVEAGLKKLR